MLTPSQNSAKPMRHMTFFVQLLILATISIYTSAALAEMYKWVDAEGNTHYSQSPPPGDIEATTIKAPPKIDPERAQKLLESRKKLLSERQQNREQGREEAIIKQREHDKQVADCDKARKRLASYMRPRVTLFDEQGNPSRATEEQRQAEIVKSKELIKTLCK